MACDAWEESRSSTRGGGQSRGAGTCGERSPRDGRSSTLVRRLPGWPVWRSAGVALYTRWMRVLLGLLAICAAAGCSASPTPVAAVPSLPVASEQPLDVFQRAPSPREIIPPPPANNWRAMQTPDPPAPAKQPPAKAEAKPPAVPARVLPVDPLMRVLPPPPEDLVIAAAARCRSDANSCDTAKLTPEQRGACHEICGHMATSKLPQAPSSRASRASPSRGAFGSPCAAAPFPAAPSPEKNRLIERLEAAPNTCEKTCWERARAIWSVQLDPLQLKSGGL